MKVQVFERQLIESDEGMWSIGFGNPAEIAAYHIVSGTQHRFYHVNYEAAGLVFGYQYGVSSHQTKHIRTVYKVLDLLGDVGGLFDAFSLIGQSLITLVAGGRLSNYLNSQLFYRADSRSRPSPSDVPFKDYSDIETSYKQDG